MGRPKGEGFEKELSLEPIANRLHSLLEKEIILSKDVSGDDTKKQFENLNKKSILLLENLRFDAREQKDDKDFAKELADLVDIYINDAFGVSHRAHSSIHAITEYFDKDHCGAGFLLQKEVTFFGKIMNNPERPFAAIVGGSKVSGKLEALFSLIPKIDKLFIGGGMAFSFLKAKGFPIGDSLVEDHLLEEAKKVIVEAKKEGVKIYFPVDFIVADKFDGQAHKKDVTYQEIPDGYMGLDMGNASVEMFKVGLHDCKTILWNGPMGVFEIPQFAQGSLKISHFLGKLEEATTIIGGGDTANVALMANDVDNMTFISTGGGASLELIEGKQLPGVEKLLK
jgi:phosphoglycerate kinase